MSVQCEVPVTDGVPRRRGGCRAQARCPEWWHMSGGGEAPQGIAKVECRVGTALCPSSPAGAGAPLISCPQESSSECPDLWFWVFGPLLSVFPFHPTASVWTQLSP